MSFSAINLPVELLLRIVRVLSKQDLCQLRSLNSTFNELATPAVFENITVYNNYASANRFWTVLHAPHIAQHVQSLAFVEESIVADKPVWECLEAAFALLHRFPALKTLALCFTPILRDFQCSDTDFIKVYSHQWDIIAALGSNQNPLPQLQSLTIKRWLKNSPWNFLYDAVPFVQLVKSLRHLSFSVSHSRSWGRHMVFRNPIVVRSVLQRAIRLESLAISGNEGLRDEECLDVSEVATFPGLASLSLRNVLWEDGKVGHQDGVEPPAVEGFIARHGKTLKKLKLHNCVIGISLEERETPFCYWADVYDRLAKALTELVELEADFRIQVDECRRQYVYLGHSSTYYSPYNVAFHLDGTEQDGVSLEAFKAVVKNRGTDADSKP